MKVFILVEPAGEVQPELIVHHFFLQPSVDSEFRVPDRHIAGILEDGAMRIRAVHPQVSANDDVHDFRRETVFTLRQGRKVHFQVFMSGFDGPDVAGKTLEIVREQGDIWAIPTTP